MLHAPHLEQFLDPLQEAQFTLFFGQLSHYPRTDLVPGIIQRIEIEYRFFIRMDGKQRTRHRRLTESGQYRFDTDFRLHMQLAYFATERVRPFAGTESPAPRQAEATRIIVAYRSGSRIEQGRPHQIGIGLRHESDQLQQSTFLGAQDTDIFQPDQFRQTEVHASRRIIEIGMGGIDHQVILAGLHHAPLDIGRTGQGFEGFKGQRMMRDNQITPHLYRLVHYIFGDVETKKHTGSKLIHITDLHTCIVKTFLQWQRSVLFDFFQYILNP